MLLYNLLIVQTLIQESNPIPILLGRPFLKTTRTKIDVHDGTLTMEFNGEIIRFNIFEAMRYPGDVHSVFNIDIIDSLVQDRKSVV